MKEVQMFYLASCPHCKRAFKFLDELTKEPRYKEIQIKKIEESEEPDIANAMDYYYVPTFFVDHKKIHEGVIEKEDVIRVLEAALT